MKISPNIKCQNQNNSNHNTKTAISKQIDQTEINSSDSIDNISDITNNILPEKTNIESVLNNNLNNNLNSVRIIVNHQIPINTVLEPCLDSYTYVYKSVLPLNYPFVKYFNSNPKIYSWLTCLLGLIHVIVIFFGIKLNPLISYTYIMCSSLVLNYLYFAKADIYIIKQIIKTWDFIFLSLQIAFFQIISSVCIILFL